LNLTEKLNKIEARVLELMRAHNVPGVSIGLIINGHEHYISLGVTSIENPLEVTPETIFQLASISKTFTATLAMKMIEQGQLELDAPIQKYLPDFRVQDQTASATATVRNLLTHTGGWYGDFFPDTGDDSNALELYVKAMSDLPQLVPVNSFFSYSNASFSLLGRVLEVVSGQSFDLLMRSQLLEPMGLHDSVYWAHEAITKRVAIGHTQSKDGQTEIISDYRLTRARQPRGGLLSSAKNLMRYAQYQMGSHGDDLISSAIRRQMQTKTIHSGFNESTGLTWLLTESNGTEIVFHDGSLDGFRSELGFVTNQNFAYTCLVNSDSGEAVKTELVALIRELFLDFKHQTPNAIAATPALLEQYVGRFVPHSEETHSASDAVEIRLEADELRIEVNLPNLNMVVPATNLMVCANDVLVVRDGPMQGGVLECLRENDQVKFIRSGGRVMLTRA
jgi:CubicO group peptidase (beta-lactamase class C family)